MSLTYGDAPFAHPPAGDFNFELDLPDTVLYMEPSQRWIRVYFGGEAVADSRRVRLLHRTGGLPVYYFPVADVRMELLEETDRREADAAKGETVYRTVRVGDDVAEHAAWLHPDPPASAAFLEGLVAFDWGAMDTWFAEDEELEVHPKDPYHRVDVLRTSRHVRVRVDGELVADTRRAVMLLETGLPPRYYIPPADVRMERLEPSDTHTRCPYKGVASYYSVRTAEGLHRDMVWYYPEPLVEAGRIQGRLAFYNERVDIELDGEAQDRPVTVFS